MMKRCTKCKKHKSSGRFNKNKRSKDGLHCWCKKCLKEYQQTHKIKIAKRKKVHYQTHKSEYSKRNEKYRQSEEGKLIRFRCNLENRYNITLKQYNQILGEQNGVCAICKKPERCICGGKPKRLAVDHNHLTGKVRGLLCVSCNNRLGLLESRDFVEKATEYLKKYET